jgi:Transposase IS66 family
MGERTTPSPSKAGYAAGLRLKFLLEKSHQWWYFLDVPEVPPDNNRAERSLGLGVTKRKVSGGFSLYERHGRYGQSADCNSVLSRSKPFCFDILTSGFSLYPSPN